MVQTIRKWLGYCDSVLIYGAIGSTFIMMCLTTADAMGRYLFNRPIPISYELTEKYLMPMTFALALAFAYREGTFIRVTLLTDRMTQYVRLWVNYLVQVITILYSVSMFLATAKRSIQAMHSNMNLATINIPMWPAYWIISVSIFFMTLWISIDLLEVKKGKSSLFSGEEAPIS